MSLAPSVLLVFPSDFAPNTEAQEDNAFMHQVQQNRVHAVRSAAWSEFLSFQRALSSNNVKALVFPSPSTASCPDAVFLNNWFSTHRLANGQRLVIYYPMKCVSRRSERESVIKAFLESSAANDTVEVLDLSPYERDGLYLEGTGSMVMDHKARVIYACLSERTNPRLLDIVGAKIGYDVVTFTSVDTSGRSVYHTNVMLSIGMDTAVICADSIANESERASVLQRLSSSKRVIQISVTQMNHFCGNILQVSDVFGKAVWCMSSKAHAAFTEEQRTILGRCLHVDVDTIETVGGGGVRCMLAEQYF